MPPATSRQSLPQLVDRGVALLREYLETPRTDLLRQLAPIIVELRARSALDDGRPDWGGRSPGYRERMADLYRRAGVPKERLDTIQAAMRYHIGNLIRERASREELLAVGLTTTAPRDRNAETREALRALSAASGGKTPRHDVSRLTVYAQALLEYVEDAAVSLLDSEHAAVTRMSLERIQARAGDLREMLPRRSDADEQRGGSNGTGGAGLRSV